MRVAHVSDCYMPRLGGIERQVFGLAYRQRQLGYDVEVVTSVPGSPQQREAGGIPVRRPAGRSGREQIRYAASKSGVDAVLRGDFDLVHAHISTFSPMAMLAAHAASRRGTPTVVTLHSLWAYATPVLRLGPPLVRWGDLPIAWSAVSSAAAADLRKGLPPGTRVELLPNAVDPRDWVCRRRPHEWSHVVLASVLRFTARKRPMALLKMLRESRERIPSSIDVEAVLIGAGPKLSRMERYLARHGMDTWVRMPGRLSHAAIREELSRCQLYVAPANLESFGIAALEARASGLPVVAKAGTGITEFVEAGRDGLLVGSDGEMVDAIVRLGSDPDLRATMAAHARTHPPAFSWEAVLRRCDEIYAGAAALSGAPAALPDGLPVGA